MQKTGMRRFFGVICATFIAGALLTGCQEEASSGKPVEVVFWTGFAPDSHIGQGVGQLIEKFNASQTATVVRMETQEGYAGVETKLTAALLADSYPDIVMVTSQTLQRMQGSLADLNTVLKKETIENLVEGLRADATYDGKLKASAFNRSMPILYVNLDMLEKAGFSAESIKTWDDVEAIAEKFSRPNEGLYGFETLIPTEPWQFFSLVDQMDGKVYADDGKSTTIVDPAVRIMTYLTRLMDKGLMKNPAKIPGAQNGDFDGDVVLLDDFYAQRTPMITLSTGYCGTIEKETKGKFRATSILLPKWADGKVAVKAGGGAIGLVEKVSPTKKKAAASFIEFLLSDESVVFLHGWTGYMPVTKSAVVSPAIAELHTQKPILKNAALQAEFVRPYERNPKNGEVETILVDYNTKIMLDSKLDIRATVIQAAAEIDKVLQQ